jgi:chaperonin GroES
MKFRPLGDRVVVRRIKEDQKTAGGIIIPDTVAEKPQEGEVISVGPGAPDNNGKLVPTTVKAGEYVLFGKWSGTEVKLDGEERDHPKHIRRTIQWQPKTSNSAPMLARKCFAASTFWPMRCR